MATNFDRDWNLIAEACIARIKANKTASITSVIEALIQARKIANEKPTYEDLLIIEGLVISNQRYKSDRYGEIFNVTLSHKNWIERNQVLYSVILVLSTTVLTSIASIIADELKVKQPIQVTCPQQELPKLLKPGSPDSLGNPVQK